MYKFLKLNLARNSLRYIIKTYRIKEIFIPYYLCGVIRQSILKENCKPKFYHIDNDFMPSQSFKDTDYILYPNYFGICDKNVEILTQKYPKLIVDNAHSFYSKPNGFACFNSARKFLPVYNGSFLWIKNADISLEKENFIMNTPLNKKDFLINENSFNQSEMLFANDKVLEEIDKNNNFDLRKNIFEKLHKKYAEKNLINIDMESANSPFCYPLLFYDEKEADDFVKNLTDKNIPIYRYWENLPKNYNEYKFYRKLVAIPLDN